ncbi:transcription factor AP-2, alpha (predicted), isoform CRA_b [Rattus norvegicus]|uniref:Transcription factor AP-2, alpha (Predicted), isoform CRA_b n=1 Tax=Rattus norvegicus TaxID=10116 RepID=A6J786_RAT|nr:transcription factor AP-2, alpha (predicted), isoform CRA_b [Rattus norvegicus]EDL98234.1 transcription factor AP-2, alpha (predicted), isoform CRA_b [Rattus norvegicus]EDL98236.1 transcription factor AP-2, alpha (predicted), isoform CRA_b [Rattus norvegicus]
MASAARRCVQRSPPCRTISPRPSRPWTKCTSATIPTATRTTAPKAVTKKRNTESEALLPPAPARLTGRRPHSPLPHPAGDSSGTSHSYCCCYSLRCRAALRLRSPPDCSLDCQWGCRFLLSALPQLPHQHQHPLYPRVEPKRTEQVVKPAKKSSVAFVKLFFFKSTTNIKTFFFKKRT